tara:strand:+ start:188 stop:496 length:309 start_codon:yes stop_codon:yes gene_type:complete
VSKVLVTYQNIPDGSSNFMKSSDSKHIERRRIPNEISGSSEVFEDFCHLKSIEKEQLIINDHKVQYIDTNHSNNKGQLSKLASLNNIELKSETVSQTHQMRD